MTFDVVKRRGRALLQAMAALAAYGHSSPSHF